MSFPIFLQQSSCFLLPTPRLNTTVTPPPQSNYQVQNSCDLGHVLFLCIYIYKVKLGWMLNDSCGDLFFFISHQVLLAVFGSNLLISLNQLSHVVRKEFCSRWKEIGFSYRKRKFCKAKIQTRNQTSCLELQICIFDRVCHDSGQWFSGYD